MCNPAGAITDIAANLATGGLYSQGKAAVDTVDEGSPFPAFKALRMGPMGAAGSDVAEDISPDAQSIFDNTWSAFSAVASLGAAFGGPDVLLSGGEGFGAAGADVLGPMDSSLVASSSLATPPLGSLGLDTVSGAAGADSLMGSGGDALTDLPAQTQADLAAFPETAAPAQASPLFKVDTLSSKIPNPGTIDSLQVPTAPSVDGMIGAGVHGAGGTFDAASLSGPKPDGGWLQWFKDLPPATQAVVGIVAGQTLSGAAGGLFQGISAEERLQLDKLINEQRQGQVNYRNQNNAKVPLMKFAGPTGPAGRV